MTSAATTARPATAPLDALRAQFVPVPGYLDAATSGLPARGSLDVLRTELDAWAAGGASTTRYDEAVEASRAAYARLVGVDPALVAVGAQTSAMVGQVAASLPDGARVVAVEGDFTSVTWPFMTQQDRGVQVRHVPLDALADAVADGCDLVAFSLVQSVDGRVADVDAVRAAAAQVGATTLADLTQAGWLPVDAGAFDLTVCSAYKWLAAPRGVGFLTATPDALERVRPGQAGWYAGEERWASTYGPAMHLATTTRRLDVSPAWLCWAGAVPALEAFAGTDPELVRAHDVGLTDLLCDGLDLPRTGTAFVALPDPDGTVGAALAAAGVRAATRGGGVRMAFHVWNSTDDVDRVLRALRP
ncbi:aminotransferase class V-fold PLP-dependent enzyme [Cellulomonas sp. SLBN-39]|uniref:aminotransferase class V-fold PLP-dependent enzyme n=1 Tax=Cellulomonas sp. SLBN-39 TaxID=2768446 RepID=UPI001153F888|nr:aminotransferase class V-fold PLP-dependent enzyme [Cellulomonas sp. SLBN-39]TQL02855.1 selenocysteine lyase/cysteine desulfurase [Cellulomonas sp. SLBN-39]